MLSKPNSKSDEDLMAGIQNGSESDFEALYHRYARKLMAFFYNMMNRDKDKAQDFVQELFLKVLNKSHQFNGDMNFAAWIFTIASNMCKNEYRKLDHQKTFFSNYTGETNYVHSELNLDVDRFQQSLSLALDRLHPEKKELFILRFEEELSIEQIAVILNVREGTVKSRLFYLRKDLVKELKIFDPKLN